MDNWRLVAFVAAYFRRFGCFLPLWRCVWLSAGPSIIVERSFRLVSVLRWLVGLMNDRRTTDAGQGRPQGWGCGGGAVRAHVPDIYMNLSARAVTFCNRFHDGGAPLSEVVPWPLWRMLYKTHGEKLTVQLSPWSPMRLSRVTSRLSGRLFRRSSDRRFL